LLDELNNLAAEDPAYHHFETMKILPPHIREWKDKHFRRNYSKELVSKKEDLEAKYFDTVE